MSTVPPTLRGDTSTVPPTLHEMSGERPMVRDEPPTLGEQAASTMSRMPELDRFSPQSLQRAIRAPRPPSVALQRGIAIATLVMQATITVTGSVVRVTQSGLGCPDWPGCFKDSLVPDPRAEVAWLHQWVEFGNRMMTGLVGFVALACLVVILLAEPRRRRVVTLAAAMPIGVVVQGLVGGLTVYMGLAWWSVSVHLLLSMVLVWLAVLLIRAVSEGDEPAEPTISRVPRRLLLVAAGLLPALLFAGTLVTAAGPHAGDAETPRLPVNIELLAKVHAGLLFAFLAALVTLGVALRRTGCRHHQVWQRYRIALVVVTAQGVLGLVQYWTGVPEVLVSLHVLGAASVVVAMAALWVSTRDRGVPAPAMSGDPRRELDQLTMS